MPNPSEHRDHQREGELLNAALELPRVEVAAFLDRACGLDGVLRERLERLLAAHRDASLFLEKAAVSRPGEEEGREGIMRVAVSAPPATIGRYKPLEKIGEGGCGVVYMAEQEKPVRRRVALKIIKPGMDSREVIARFEAERQALAMMDHPNIAKVHDGGVTDTGRPYFVMELVRGVRITKYCQEHQLPIRERLELFTQVCSAVLHAHQKGVIHRDLKPSNILVTEIDGQPVPKVIDFGIAKATEQKLTDKTLFTQFAQFVGTPAYMSPEQAAMTGTDIDTRSDIYSLGVLLYELLTGTTPFDAQALIEAGFDEMRRIIRETEPPKPSTRLTQVGRESAVPGPPASAVGERGEGLGGQRSAVGGQPAQVSDRRVGGDRKPKTHRHACPIDPDLDWIVMKCLEKDRTRRYDTTSSLATDILRHLNHEPISACPPSTAYRLRKWVRRNKGIVLAASAVLAALVAGTAVSVWQAAKADRERADAVIARKRAEDSESAAKEARDSALAAKQRAGEQAAIAAAVNEFVRNDLFLQAGSEAQADRGFVANPNLTVREALDRAAERIGDRFQSQPMVEAAVRRALANGYQSTRADEKAIPHLERATALLTEHAGPGHAETLNSRHDLGIALLMTGQTDKAVRILEEVLEWQRKQFEPDHRGTLNVMNSLANALAYSGQLEKAADLSRELLDRQRRALGEDDRHTLRTLYNLATYCRYLGRLDEAAGFYEQAVTGLEKSHGPDYPAAIDARHGLAVTWHHAGHLDKALPALEKTLEQRAKAYGRDHPATLTSISDLAAAWRDKKDYDKAIPLFEEALEICRRTNPANHPDLLESITVLAVTLHLANRASESLPLYEEAVRLRRDHFGADHPKTLTCLGNFALACQDAGELEKSAELNRQLLDSRRRTQGDSHPDTLAAMRALANTLLAAGETAEAAEWKQRITDAENRPVSPAPGGEPPPSPPPSNRQ